VQVKKQHVKRNAQANWSKNYVEHLNIIFLFKTYIFILILFIISLMIQKISLITCSNAQVKKQRVKRNAEANWSKKLH
jgi:uncharacterized membrane protein